MTDVITWEISSHGRVMVATCAHGTGDSRRSNGSDSTPLAAATAAGLSWSNHTPFGRPVVPPVQQTTTGWSGGRLGRAGGSASRYGASRLQGTMVPAVGGRTRVSSSG